MTAVDTNVWIAFAAGIENPQTTYLTGLLNLGEVCIPGVVVSELLSDPHVPAGLRRAIGMTPQLDVTPGFWERAGQLRARLRKRGLRPKLPDTLIAQTCLDHDLILLTLDRDFRPFARHEGLLLAVP
jgi:hypothetical protein